VLHDKRFGRYEILRKLGRSMTDVYLALDEQEGRTVALKIIEESHDPATQLALSAERRGVLIQKQLHEADSRILEVYDFGEESGCFFVAMEYVEGRSISEIIQAEKRLEPARAVRYAREVLNQLERLHSFVTEIDGRKRAVVHGDIKPSNIQIDRNDQVRLLDFGIAKVITFTHNLTHHNLGSPSYCSPERLLKGQVDPNVDLWAAGVTLYEMIVGTPPYQAQTTRKLEALIQSRRPPRALPASCPPALRAIISRSLAADLDRRYPNAAEFERDLAAFLEGKPTTAETDTAPAWDSNETIERAPEIRSERRVSLPTSGFLREFKFVFSRSGCSSSSPRCAPQGSGVRAVRCAR
jgi:eukaryotic-like serine/threonine-protein kinase